MAHTTQPTRSRLRLLDRQGPVAIVVTCVVLVACTIGFRSAVGALNIYLAKESAPLRRSLSTVPKWIGPWRAIGQDQALDAAMIEELGTSDVLSRRYMREPSDGAGEGGENTGIDVVDVHLAYYTGLIDAVPHVPDRCMVAHGWTELTRPTNYDIPLDTSRWSDDPEATTTDGEPFPVVNRIDPITQRASQVRMPLGPLRVRLQEFQSNARPDTRLYAGYFFIANGRTTPSPEEIRLLAFNKSERYAYYLKVQLSMHATEDFTVEDYLETSAELLEDLLPQIMWCVPDWAELQSRDAPAEDSGS